tara:strand:- start:549 stop:749 length:201 start_codon:yes stop_codon:yes gene_type:complete
MIQEVQDYFLGVSLFFVAPFIPMMTQTSTSLFNVSDATSTFTLIIQFLSAILLIKRIMKRNDNEES